MEKWCEADRQEHGLNDTFREPTEPAFNAPWPALVLVAMIAGSYLLQRFSGDEQALVTAYSFAPSDLDVGRYVTLVTHLFLHGGWAHVGMNAVMCLAFAPPVSRLLGEGAVGAVALLLLYLVCGVAGGLAFAAFHAHDGLHQLIGASGAVSGLMGAASRLLYRQGRLAPLLDRSVVGFTGVWVALNVVLGMIGLAPGMGQVTIAWEAHLGGYFAGLLLIGPLALALRRVQRERPPSMEA